LAWKIFDMSNLRLINETSATSVSSISVTDVFSADFDIYKVVIKDVDSTAENYTYMKLINSSGSIVTASLYDYASEYLRSYTSFSPVIGTATGVFPRFGVQNTGTSDGGTTVAYFFNPYSSSTYTSFINEHSGQGSLGLVGLKGIGQLRENSSITGMNIYPASGTFDTITVQVFGIRVD